MQTSGKKTSRKKIALIGAGNIGGELAALIARKELGDVVLLDIPENYYEDLAARLGLDDTQIAALQARGLLYDQDATGGSFRHAYTAPFQDRFFLEIVERSGGLDADDVFEPIR